ETKTKTQRVEIYVDGSLVYQTREPIAPFCETAIRDAEDALSHFQAIRSRPQEVFAVMTLNGANQPIKTRWVTVGLLDSNQVHPREVFADVLMDRAAGVMFAHNHPSGTLRASAEDLALTKRLVRAGEILGIRILDHLIVTDTGFLSMRQNGDI
ncbi:RadC family protein, partial [Candidatus Bipolaricaulota bacterium]